MISRGVRVVHRIAERVRQQLRDLPVGVARLGLHHLAHARDAPLGIGEGAVLLQERGARQEHVRELRRLVQEQVLHDDAFHRRERRGHVLRVGVGLRDVLALDVQALELAVERRLEHVRNAQARLVLQLHAPGVLELRAHRVVGDVAVARELVREGAHVARALHVVLAAQRIDAHALAADVAGRHGEIRDAHHHGRALAVLGDAEAVVDRAVAARWRTGAPRRAPRSPARR